MAKKQYNVKTSAVAATERRARKYGIAGGSVGAGGYIEFAGDVAGKLDRGVFESMFERIVTGTDEDGNEKWYIKAKATLVSVGDVVAYGVSDIAGSGGGGSSTLANLKDVLLGTLKDGDVIKWDASLGKWVNGQGGGGLDESSLAAYLTANNYVTSAVLGNYVTVDTEQTITGVKTFDAEVFAKYGISLITTATGGVGVMGCLGFNRNTRNGDVPNPDYTAFQFTQYANALRLEVFNVKSGTAFDVKCGLIADSIAKRNGTSSQFLKADGSVDDTQYLYHRRTGNGFNIDTIDAVGGGLYEVPQAAGTVPFNKQYWQKVLDFGANDNGYRVQLNTPLTLNGSLYIRHKIGGTWHGWREILDSTNYPAYLDGRYVNASGDTMTGRLFITTSGRTLELGSANSDWCHYSTDAPTGHWFNKRVSVQGEIYAGANYNQLVWHAGNDGSGSGLDADMLDGIHSSQFLLSDAGYISEAYMQGTEFQRLAPGCYIYPRGGASDMLIHFGNTWASLSGLEFWSSYPQGNVIYYRKTIDSNRFAGAWSYFISNDNIGSHNAGSATVLQNTRYIWGQAFNGGGDVNGTFFYQNDGTLKIYAMSNPGQPSVYGLETVAIQTAFNVQDPETSAYPYTYPDRNVLALQPRGGRVGIGLANPSCMLHVNGTILANGDVAAYSDARLKSDIRPLTNRGFIEPKTYIKDGKRCIGFLAQDVMAIYPELVTETGGADNWLALNYGNLVAVLEAQIIDIDTRLKRLEARA